MALKNRGLSPIVLCPIVLVLIGACQYVYAATQEELVYQEEIGFNEPPQQESDIPKYLERQNNLRQELRTRFLNHVKNATNVTVPHDPNEFPWRIDWKSQQTYCKSVADALFKHKGRLTFREPDASLQRDGKEKAHKTMSQAVASLADVLKKHGEPSKVVQQVGEGVIDNLYHDYYISSNHYIVRADIRPKKNFPERGSDDRVYMWYVSPDAAAEAGKVSISEVELDYINRGLPRSNVLAWIDDQPVLLGFGVYSSGSTKEELADEKLSKELAAKGGREPLPSAQTEQQPSYYIGKLGGKPGQRYVFVFSPNHELYGKWALSEPYFTGGDGYRYDIVGISYPNFLMDRHLMSCVINFDVKSVVSGNLVE